MTTGSLTIQDNTTLVQYTAVGESSFVFNFPILAASELKVSRNQVLKTYGTDYSITGIGDDGGGSITLLAGPSTPGDVWTLWQDMPIERLTGFSAGAATILGAALNAEFAARLRVEQQLRREIRNALRIPPDDPVSGQDMVLPSKALRAGKYQAYDALGKPIASSGTGNDSALRSDLAISTAGGDGSRLSGYRRNAVGTVARSVGAKLDDLVMLSDWGTTQVALQAAADYCFTNGAYLIGTNNLTVTLTSTLTLKCKGDLSMMTVQGNSANFTPMVRVGETAAAVLLLNGELRLPRVVNSAKVVGAGWATFQVGVDLANLYQAEIFIPEILGFDTGLWLGGFVEGCVHNDVHVLILNNNKRGVRIGGKATTGWANQNNLRLDRCFMNTAEGVAVAGTRHLWFAPFNVALNDVSWPNGNTVTGASVEGDGPEYLVELAGNNQVLENCRFEATVPRVLQTGHAAATKTYENLILGGYGSISIVFSSAGIVQTTSVINPRKSSLTGDDVVMNLQNVGGSALPQLQGFDAAAGSTLNKDSAATDWNYRLSAQKLSGKGRLDVAAKVELDFVNGLATAGELRATSNATAVAAGQISIGKNTQTTVGAAGGASALPATPTGYLRFFLGATEFVVPYYARV